GGPSAGRCFAVGGSNLYEVFSDGSSAILGNVGSDSLPVTFAAIPEEIAVASAGNLFVYTLTAIVLPSPILLRHSSTDQWREWITEMVFSLYSAKTRTLGKYRIPTME